MGELWEAESLEAQQTQVSATAVLAVQRQLNVWEENSLEYERHLWFVVR